jgi:hypothetical protein
MSARADYLRWRHSATVGCVFARFFSSHPDEYGQQIVEVSQSADPSRVAAAIAKRVEQYVADESVNIASLIMPTIKTPEALVKVALALRDQPQWIVTTSHLTPPPQDLVSVLMFREIPFQTSSRRSEVLAFGPFRGFPATRKSPVAAFEIFVGEPMANDPVSQKPTNRANLAHADLKETPILKIPNMFDGMLEKTRVLRLKSLGNVDDHRAKAKVSFVVSRALARKLGLES